MSRETETLGHLWPSAEQRLLLEAALLPGDRAIAAFQAWRARVDMEGEFTPESYRLLPLVYHAMRGLDVEDPVMGRLKGVYRRTWVETHRLFHRTVPVVARLVAAGVDVLLTKGVPLALSYYRNPALRPMSDVDLAVPPEQLDDTLGILRDAGWRMTWPDADMRRYRHGVQCFGPEGAEIDLHWRAMDEAAAPKGDTAFRDRAEPLDFMGTTVRQPGPTHALLLTVVHGVRWNIETPVRWIPDALAILGARGADVDWDAVLALAARHRVSRRLGLGLSWLAEALHAPVPPEVLARLRTTRLSMFERFESRVILAPDESVEPSPYRTQLNWLVEYGRHGGAPDPLAFVAGYPHYVRYRLGLDGRREILPRIVQSVMRRARGTAQAGAPPHPRQGGA